MMSLFSYLFIFVFSATALVRKFVPETSERGTWAGISYILCTAMEIILACSILLSVCYKLSFLQAL